MNENDALKMAKDSATTAEQIRSLVGRFEKVDRLLANHSNISPKSLELLSLSKDKIVIRNVLKNANTSEDLLIRLGAGNIDYLLKSPSLNEFVNADKNFLLKFDSAKLTEILTHTECTDAIAHWALRHGRLEHQAAYISTINRSGTFVLKFFKSKFPQIVAMALCYQDKIFELFAIELGYVPNNSDDDSDADIDEKVRDWYDAISDRGNTLWRKFVPKSGCASTVQGELLRRHNKLVNEFYKNGNLNWLDSSDDFCDHAQFILQTLKTKSIFSPLIIKIIESDVKEIISDGKSVGKIVKRKLRFDVDDAHERLGNLIVLWSERYEEIANMKIVPAPDTNSESDSGKVEIRKPNLDFNKSMTLSRELAAVLGKKTMSRPQVTIKIWEYIEKHRLQDTKNKNTINADSKLREVFGGKSQVSMFEMNALISGHLSVSVRHNHLFMLSICC